MGNWRTVNMIGTCSAEDVPKLRAACLCDMLCDDLPEYHPLSFTDRGSICGLNNWPAENINVVGNMFERDYSVEDVAKACEALVQVAPSLTLKIHCGGDYERKECVATITVADGRVAVGSPEVQTLMDISTEQMMGNFLRCISR